ncbi:hypothetical protein LS684_11480 [Cytobacillus spongiae]|jgi:hypothetical protein|uniref:hypothetical protein n=1 Tax=Cytobacillus spongiae TaxID=2901381 RepID=UPI001F33E325|nr:hypothetical protein [Cytobacillus spongiae]UII54308.1 hypothetical protein LS684_11480 [Cytobacillus spongiae]
MKIFTNQGLYKLKYEHQYYDHLEFLRLDHICKIGYVTLKNVLTGEIYTFEQDKIVYMKKKMHVQNTKTQKMVATV